MNEFSKSNTYTLEYKTKINDLIFKIFQYNAGERIACRAKVCSLKYKNDTFNKTKPVKNFNFQSSMFSSKMDKTV